MKIEDRALPAPAELEGRLAEGEEVVEIARIWWTGREPHLIIRPVMRDPVVLGRILAEASWYFATAYADNGKGDRAEIFETIKRGWSDAHAEAAAARAEAKQ